METTPETNGRRGSIMPVGGAEEKLRNPEILDRFVELLGGDGAKIVVIPTASRLNSTGRRWTSSRVSKPEAGRRATR